MILSKAGRLSLLAGLLCLLLVGFTGAANAVIRWDVFPSPTEVINSGRSEVLGSVTLVVQPNQTAVTGNASGGPTQIAILYNNRVMIDNNYGTPAANSTSNTWSGIRLFTSNAALASTICFTGCTSANFFVTVENRDITGQGGTTGQYSGYLTINIPGNIPMAAGDVIRVDGVRGRIDKSDLATPGNDAFAQLQSINDPAGNQFFPETIRVAKSFLPMLVGVAQETAVLCQPSFGLVGGGELTTHVITVTENFPRAFVSRQTSGVAETDPKNRLDSYGATDGHILGNPSNGTMLQINLAGIPASVSTVNWQASVPASGAGGAYVLQSVSGKTPLFTAGTAGGPANGTALAIYEYFTSDQTGASDINTESFGFKPQLVLSGTNQQDTGSVTATVSLYPGPASGEPATGLYQPYSGNKHPLITDGNKVNTPSMPRFTQNFMGGGVYEVFAPCICYLLYPYTTSDSFFNTGIVVANTSDDSGAIPTSQAAARQRGNVKFWLYDFRLGNVTPTAGVFFTDAGHTVPLGVDASSPAFDANGLPLYYAGQSARGLVSQLVATPAITNTLAAKGFTDFAGYIIAKAEFQFCHGFAFISDKNFAVIAQGYVAGLIPDPSAQPIKKRTASNFTQFSLAGESINN